MTAPADFLTELDAVLDAVRKGGYYDALPRERQSDYMDTDVARTRLLDLIGEREREARIDENALALQAVGQNLTENASNMMLNRSREATREILQKRISKLTAEQRRTIGKGE
jgi:hypothetical protein